MTPQAVPASESSSAQYEVPSAALRIAQQLSQRVNGHAASGDAFVVSLYGEWGVGKTHCLREIDRWFGGRLETDLKACLEGRPLDHLVVPLLFDPWQFEHEEHLVVPLLKTIERALRRVVERVEQLREETPKAARAEEFTQRAEALGQALQSAAGTFGDVAVALLSGFKFKFAPLKEVIGIEVELSGKDAIESGRKGAEQRRATSLAEAPKPRRWWQAFGGEAAQTPPGKRPPEEDGKLAAAHDRLAVRESLYFDVQRVLLALTSGKPPALRLIVLIDDLDRCLPEKAIQVLESVKLFLNVAGFSFVLAVDDEVVERGIAHRYRAYGVERGSTRIEAAPISGAEYLEKIVHLPIHLQRWTREEAAGFLRHRYGNLFGAPPKQGEPPSPASPLLDLVLEAVPLVPRKLIRLAEALDFQRTHFVTLGATALWQPTHAARVVALQQLYPALFRHLRLRSNRYWRLFTIERDFFGEPRTGGAQPQSLSTLRERFDKRAGADNTVITGTQADTLRENLDLLDLVHDGSLQRGHPDPLALFASGRANGDAEVDSVRPGMSYDEFALLYMHGLAPPSSAAAESGSAAKFGTPSAIISEPATLPASVASSDAEAAETLDITPADQASFLERLLQPDRLARREFLQSLPVGAVLPSAVFMQLIARLGSDSTAMIDIELLRDLDHVLTPLQLLRLMRTAKVIERLAAMETAA